MRTGEVPRGVVEYAAGDVLGERLGWPRERVEEGEDSYGFSYEVIGEVPDGKVVRMTLHAEGRPVSFNGYILDESVLRGAAEDAGMVSVTIEDPKIAPELEGDEDDAYWERFLERPLFKVMTAVKG